MIADVQAVGKLEVFLTTSFDWTHMILSTFLSHEILQTNDLHGNVDHPIGVKNHQKEIS